jgi:hypothetical protein
MEKKQTTQPQSKTCHPTILGTLFFTLFNLIFLSILSWILLEIWFSVKIILNSDDIYNTIQQILNNNHIIMDHNHTEDVDTALNIFHNIKNTIHALCGSYIGENIIRVFLDVTEITLTRSCLFIQFTPFMIVFLCVLMIDGLVLRDKRKFQGARESTFIFHRLKPLAKISFFSLFFIYMVIPYSVLPGVFLVPMVMLSSLFTMLAIKSFKKYL